MTHGTGWLSAALDPCTRYSASGCLGSMPIYRQRRFMLGLRRLVPQVTCFKASPHLPFAMSVGWVSPKFSLCPPLPVPLGIYIHLGLSSGPPCKHLQFATEQMPSIRFWILHACKNTRNAVRQDIQASTSHCCAPHTLFPVVVLKKNGTPPHSSAPPTSRYLLIIMLRKFDSVRTAGQALHTST